MPGVKVLSMPPRQHWAEQLVYSADCVWTIGPRGNLPSGLPARGCQNWRSTVLPRTARRAFWSIIGSTASNRCWRW